MSLAQGAKRRQHNCHLTIFRLTVIRHCTGLYDFKYFEKVIFECFVFCPFSTRPLSCGDDSKNMSFDGSFCNPAQLASTAAPPLPPKRRSSGRTPCNSQLSFTDSCSSSQMQCNSSTPSPPPNMSASFYDNADESNFSSSFCDFRNELCKSDFSCNSDWSNITNNRSPDSVSPISKSPTSSLDSILDKSTEDVLMSVSKSASASFYPLVSILYLHNTLRTS